MYYVEYIVTNRIIEAKFGQILSGDFRGHVDFYDEFFRRSAFCGQRFKILAPKKWWLTSPILRKGQKSVLDNEGITVDHTVWGLRASHYI